jgi:NAD-dependent deacetylase
MSSGRQTTKAGDLVRKSRVPVVLTGAGFSAECGIPVFRGAGGLWEGFRPEELATPQAFHNDPEKVWRWYAWRREKVDAAEPHAGHRALVQWERNLGVVRIITQNVDGLHQRAGSKTVVELHGNMIRGRCVADGRVTGDWRATQSIPPRCSCGELLRPDVVWFGESLPEGALELAAEWIRGADLLIVAGTSGVVAPASLLPNIARAEEIPVVEVNPEQTVLTPYVDLHVSGPAGEALPRLLDPLWGTP